MAFFKINQSPIKAIKFKLDEIRYSFDTGRAYFSFIPSICYLKILALTCATNSHCYQNCFIVNLHVLESKCPLTANIKHILTIIFINL